MKNKKMGFTLVELMAVIIIISLIAILTFPNIINQIKKSKKATANNINDIVISAAKRYVSDNPDKYDNQNYCMNISELVDNDYLKEDIVSSEDNNISNKVIELKYDGKYSYKVVDKNACKISAVKYLLKKTNGIEITNYTDGDTHEMYTFSHDATVQTPALTDYRYIGNDPYNYVTFNGNELWRIIGVFTVDNGTGKLEKRIKLIRNESLGNNQWDANSKNEWVGSTMQIYLNNTYSLDESSNEMIDGAKWYLGGSEKGSASNGSILYSEERGTTVYTGRNIMWIGKVAIMYPSDYIYTYSLGVDGICYDTPGNCKTSENGNPSAGWLYRNSYYQWTITSVNVRNYGSYVFYIASSGYVFKVTEGRPVRVSFGASPVVYLKSNVKIISGDGTSSNPYQLSL